MDFSCRRATNTIIKMKDIIIVLLAIVHSLSIVILSFWLGVLVGKRKVYKMLLKNQQEQIDCTRALSKTYIHQN